MRRVTHTKGKRASSIGGKLASGNLPFGRLYARRGEAKFDTIAAIIAPNAVLTTRTLVNPTPTSLSFTTGGTKYRPIRTFLDAREKENGGVPLAILVFDENISPATYPCKSIPIDEHATTVKGFCLSLTKGASHRVEGKFNMYQDVPLKIINPSIKGYGRLLVENNAVVGFSTYRTTSDHAYGEKAISSRRLTEEMVAWINEALTYASTFLEAPQEALTYSNLSAEPPLLLRQCPV